MVSENTVVTPRPVLLVHYGELGLKGGNRSRFQMRLRDRLAEGLRHAGIDAKVSLAEGRYRIRLGEGTPGPTAARALAVVTRIPGVANVASSWEVPTDLDAIQVAALRALDNAPPGTFKVETRRSYKAFPLTSIEVSQRVAPHLAEQTGRQADVRRPDVTIRIEVTKERSFASGPRRSGPGGLPVGSAGRLLAFLSGGIDSPVAAWLMIRRGARVTAVHFHNRTLQGAAVLEKLEDICGVLAWSAARMPLLVVPFESCQRAIVGLVPAEVRMIVYRRAMFRIGARLAARERALGFVTGDSLGQVASQTAENLRTIHAAASLPVYAPLIGLDKRETVQRAREIGTFDISIRPHEDCCSFLIARHPAVASRVEPILEMEAGIDWDTLVGEAVEGTRRQVIPADPAVLDA